MTLNSRPVATYRAGTTMAVPHLWGIRSSEYAKVGVAVITTQYGRITSKVLATYLQSCIVDRTDNLACMAAVGPPARKA